MKVVLLNPPAPDKKKFIREGRCTQEQGVWATLWPPISLAMIGAVLEQDGHSVRIIDCPAEGMSREELSNHIKGFHPGLVMWATGTPTISNDLGLGSDIKRIYPGILTAVFGTHVSVLDRQSMEAFADIDLIIRNEPELTARDLANRISQGQDISGIQGITHRTHANEIVRNPERPFISDLDSLPLPAWHLIKIEQYSLPMKGRTFLIVAPQRGCPFHCSFCTCQTYYGRTLRKRSVASVIAEIEHDVRTFNVRDFFFWAETFVVDKGYVAALCQAMLDRQLAISWTCNSRVDVVDEGLLKLMAQAGCWMISYGIESADQQVLDRAGKGIRVEQASRAVALAKKAGIRTAGHFIFGLPGETEASMQKTARLARGLGLDVAQFYCAVPFPGSRLYEEAVQEGWLRPGDFSSLRQDQAVMQMPTVTAETVNTYRARAFRSFYRSPAVWYRMLRLLEPRGLRQGWKTVRDFMRWSG